jgi:hypothetical protein
VDHLLKIEALHVNEIEVLHVNNLIYGGIDEDGE